MASPFNILLWCEDYFELKTIEKKQTEEKLPAFPIYLKLGHVFVKVSLFLLSQEGWKSITRDNARPQPAERQHQRNLQNKLH